MTTQMMTLRINTSIDIAWLYLSFGFVRFLKLCFLIN
jgi:hypothetical protein